MTKFFFPAIRYASDMPFAVGMVLADDEGRTVEVTYVGTRVSRTLGAPQACLLYTGSFGGHSESFVRARFPYLVFVTELVATAERREAERDWAERERIEALAEAAQHEDDLRAEIVARAEAERQRKATRLFTHPLYRPASLSAEALAEQYEFECDLRDDR